MSDSLPIWQTQNGGVLPFELLKRKDGSIEILTINPFAEKFCDIPTSVPVEVHNFEWKKEWGHPGFESNDTHAYGVIGPDGRGYWARSADEREKFNFKLGTRPVEEISLYGEHGIDHNAVAKAISAQNALIPILPPLTDLRTTLESLVTQNLSASITAKHQKDASDLAIRQHEEELRRESTSRAFPVGHRSERPSTQRHFAELPKIPADKKWDFLRRDAALGVKSAAAHSAPRDD